MFVVQVVCSDPDCLDEREVIVAELEELERDLCTCGGCTVVLAIATYEELPLSIAAA